MDRKTNRIIKVGDDECSPTSLKYILQRLWLGQIAGDDLGTELCEPSRFI
jgi:hypothetical protein